MNVNWQGTIEGSYLGTLYDENNKKTYPKEHIGTWMFWFYYYEKNLRITIDFPGRKTQETIPNVSLLKSLDIADNYLTDYKEFIKTYILKK